MTQWLRDWGADVRYALRAWMRQPVYVAIAVLSLAAGIGLNTAVFSIVDTVLLHPLPYESSPGLVRIQPREQRRPRRAASRRVVELREPQPAVRKCIDMRRGNVLTAVNADIAIAHVIADDDQNVGFGECGLAEDQRGDDCESRASKEE